MDAWNTIVSFFGKPDFHFRTVSFTEGNPQEFQKLHQYGSGNPIHSILPILDGGFNPVGKITQEWIIFQAGVKI